jgi:hypothetical protein
MLMVEKSVMARGINSIRQIVAAPVSLVDGETHLNMSAALKLSAEICMEECVRLKTPDNFNLLQYQWNEYSGRRDFSK